MSRVFEYLARAWVALSWVVIVVVAAVLVLALWIALRPVMGTERRRGIARPPKTRVPEELDAFRIGRDSGPITHADPGDENDYVAPEGGLVGTYIDAAPNRAPIIEEVRLMPRPKYTTHIAGEPHEGTQACLRCFCLLMERDERQVVGPNGPVPPMVAACWSFWPEGAEVTVGPGWSAIGPDSRAVPCR